MRPLLSYMLLCFTAAPALAQTAEAPLPTLKLGTQLVTVSALARDGKGNPVMGLVKDDFTLTQDGHPQEIRYFSEGSSLPLTLALLVDTSGSQHAYIADEIKASQTFFHAMLRKPEDRATLVQFDNNVLQLQKMTSSVEDLEGALVHLNEPHDSALPNHGGGTMLWDGIWLAAQFELGKEPGRRAMVILTDGGDNGSRFSLGQAVAEAQISNVALYPIFYGDQFANDAVWHKDNLQAIARITGGRFFIVSPWQPLSAIYAQIASDMRLQYQLAYRPPESAPKTYHRIALRTKNHKLTVQAREGFYSP
ncbi:Ca-activated chloride channel family protein [Granulicella rosea]|uniref:Ca-activated chloride channel family protein n=1 Tax=Granulicella rosea TaxID=474952 RepID=A0A239LUJ5_9BACT|nr:VWA domain-containing protein [Granulicella rosea]SNT33379.1 Ca-activated chloride channel family protein [Granulicella rosea]